MPQNGGLPSMIGQTLGHYLVVEKIGEGGMGVVYCAHDQQLDRDVALKVLPAGTLANDEARKHFRREALALAKLNHPNIETVHEFATQDGVDFLAMELVPGSVLSAVLKDGPLNEREVVRLGIQFADGLHAAHERGIVHRDIKPGNLMVTPDGRLKVLDFGLARLLPQPRSLEETVSISTENGVVAGTLPYMAPEQLRSEPVDARSDIYAAGAVLFEMATGQRPFPQMHGPELMGAILHQEAPSSRSLNPHISPGLEMAIRKSLEKNVSQRFQSARELRAVLESLSSVGSAPEGIASPRPVKSLVWSLAGAAVFIVVLGVVIGANIGGLRSRLIKKVSPQPVTSNVAGISPRLVKVRPAVAVLGFKNLSGRQDEQWISTALSEGLTSQMSAGEKLRTIPGENVELMKINLSLSDVDSYGKDTLTKIHKNIGSDYVVLGSYLAQGTGQVNLDLVVEDTDKGDLIGSISLKGNEVPLDELLSRAGAAVRGKLGVDAPTPAESAGIKASMPSNPVAIKLYAEGLLKLRTFDNLGARDLLLKSVAAEPQFALAHSALSRAWSLLGYDEKAREQAKIAFELSSAFSTEDRLWIEGQYRETTYEWDQAVKIYNSLLTSAPDNIDFGLRLAKVQISSGHAKDALTTVAALKQLPAPSSDDPRIDLAEAIAQQTLGSFKESQSAAQLAATKASADGARLLAAHAQLAECWALQNLGNFPQATSECEAAKKTFASAGDGNGVADSLNDQAVILNEEGDFARSKRMYAETLVEYRRTGSKNQEGWALNNIGSVNRELGNYAEAINQHEQALEIFRETGDKGAIGSCYTNIAVSYNMQGKFAEARKFYEDALAIQKEVGDQRRISLIESNLAIVLFTQGDLTAAKTAADDALATAQQIGNKALASNALSHVAAVLRARDQLPSALETAQQGLAIEKEIGRKGRYAETQIQVAGIYLDEGRPADAEALAREGMKELHLENQTQLELNGQALVIQSLLAQNKKEEARKETQLALSASSNNKDRNTEIAMATVVAKVPSSCNLAGDKSLDSYLADAKKQGDEEGQLEIRLALAKVEMACGRDASAREHLASLEKDARAKDFLLIARKAHSALN